MFQDLRYGLRLMVRRPGFAAIAVATLALGIGTTTAIFAVADRVLLRPVPYVDPAPSPSSGKPRPPSAAGDVSPRLRISTSGSNARERFSSMGGFQWRDVTLGGAEPERIRAARVTAGLLPTLGVQPQLGRWFLPEEDRANARPVDGDQRPLWRRRFSAEPQHPRSLGCLDGVPTEIIGVMPPGFVCPPAVVLAGQPAYGACGALAAARHQPRGRAARRALPRHRSGVWAPGVTIDGANREMNEIQAQIERDFPDYKGWRASVIPLVDQVTSTSRRAVGLLVAAVAFVLLLACANVANLLLARGVGRRREFAIRTALGAGRARLAVQVIAEALALALVGGAAGLMLAVGLVRIIVPLGPGHHARASARCRSTCGPRSLPSPRRWSRRCSPVRSRRLGMIRARLAGWLADRSGGAGACARSSSSPLDRSVLPWRCWSRRRCSSRVSASYATSIPVFSPRA